MSSPLPRARGSTRPRRRNAKPARPPSARARFNPGRLSDAGSGSTPFRARAVQPRDSRGGNRPKSPLPARADQPCPFSLVCVVEPPPSAPARINRSRRPRRPPQPAPFRARADQPRSVAASTLMRNPLPRARGSTVVVPRRRPAHRPPSARADQPDPLSDGPRLVHPLPRARINTLSPARWAANIKPPSARADQPRDRTGGVVMSRPLPRARGSTACPERHHRHDRPPSARARINP